MISYIDVYKYVIDVIMRIIEINSEIEFFVYIKYKSFGRKYVSYNICRYYDYVIF